MDGWMVGHVSWFGTEKKEGVEMNGTTLFMIWIGCIALSSFE